MNASSDLQDVTPLLALPSGSYCGQWLYVQIVRERYEHTLDYMVASGLTSAVT